MIDTVIFDLDGTLLNTLDDLTDSVNFALCEMGYPIHTNEDVRMMVGNGVRHLVRKALPDEADDESFERCLEIFEAHYKTNMRNKTAPYVGVEQMLTDIKKHGLKTAVVSNKPDAFTRQLVSELFGGYISVAIGRRDDMPGKPAPDTVWLALEQLSGRRETAVYVGDSETDVLTAHNSGLPCIGCLWGFRDRETLEAAGADYIISSPTELADLIKAI